MSRSVQTLIVIDNILRNFQKDVITTDKCICQIIEAMQVYHSETATNHYADTDSVKESEEDDRK